jgi:type II secretory pathway pseudopilin PulG
LLAIAIPTFLGVTSSANDRAAQSNLTNALTEATAQFQSAGQTFTGISALLSSSAPEYTWTGTAGCSKLQASCISVAPFDVNTANDEQGLVLAAMSKTGTCWYVAQLQAGPLVIASGEIAPNVAFNPVALASPAVAGNRPDHHRGDVLRQEGRCHDSTVQLLIPFGRRGTRLRWFQVGFELLVAWCGLIRT